MSDEDGISVDEAAARLGVKVQRVYHLIKNKKLAWVKEPARGPGKGGAVSARMVEAVRQGEIGRLRARLAELEGRE